MKKAALSRGREASFKVFASDISADALALGKENAEKAGVSGFITWEETDFFSLDSRAVLGRLGLVNGGSGDEGPFLVINPPYGKRLSGGDEDFFRRLGKHCRKNFPGWKVLALFPDEASLAAFGGQAEKLLRFRHGGLRITAGFFCFGLRF
jgi:23S rRNA G2445 N2-methylase RlmL